MITHCVIFRYKTKDAAYITFEQNILKQDYLLSLYNLFELYAKNPPKIYKRVDKRSKNTFGVVRNQSKIDDERRKFIHLF